MKNSIHSQVFKKCHEMVKNYMTSRAYEYYKDTRTYWQIFKDRLKGVWNDMKPLTMEKYNEFYAGITYNP